VDAEYHELCRTHSPELLQRLVARFDTLNPRVQVQLLEHMSAYAFGKPVQSVIVDVDSMSIDQRMERLRQLRDVAERAVVGMEERLALPEPADVVEAEVVDDHTTGSVPPHSVTGRR
jgi:hypothetical protein